MPRRALVPVSLAAITVTAAFALAGCYGSAPAPSASTDDASATEAPATASESPTATLAFPDACFLLLPGNIEFVVGGTWGDGTINTDLSTDYQTICEWYREGSDTVFVQVVATNDPEGFDAQRENANAALGDATDIELPGAAAAYSALGGSIVGFVAGDHFFQVSYIGDGTPEEAGHAAALASIISATTE